MDNINYIDMPVSEFTAALDGADAVPARDGMFGLVLVVLRLALSPLHLFTKLPVVHGVNALLGGALGLVKGALLVFLAVWVLQKLQLLVTPELVDKTVLLKFFARNSPIDLIAKL